MIWTAEHFERAIAAMAARDVNAHDTGITVTFVKGLSMYTGLMTPAQSSFKEAAHQLIDELPDDAGWDELAYRAFIREKIERGLAGSDADRVVSHEEILREFGLTR